MKEHSQEAIDEFHAQNPSRPAPTNIRRIISTIEEESDKYPQSKYPRIYDEQTNTFGEGFHRPTMSTGVDAIIPLTPEHVDALLHRTIHPEALIPTLPHDICRVWIYETTPVNAITTVLYIGQKKLSRCYLLLNPLTEIEIKRKYEYQIPTHPRRAPRWLVRDYYRHHLRAW